MNRRDPASLMAYRGAMHLLSPLAHGLLTARRARGKEHPERMSERTGRPSQARPDGPLVWLHGASVGEINSLFPIARHYRERGLGVLVTSGTVTSAEVAARQLPQGAIHQFIPLDAPSFVRRFLTHWRPDVGLIAESELWPNLLVDAHRHGTHLALLNARMSARSFRRWQRMPALIGALIGRFEMCLAQSVADAERLKALGAERVAPVGNLKFDVPAPAADAVALAALSDAIGHRPVFLAASTHEGEEEIIADAHRMVALVIPNLLTIIAPRHPQRGPKIAAMLAARHLRATRRVSAGTGAMLPARDTAVYVADTIGEMGLFYRIARIAFVGRSLAVGGGQNPIEPAKLGAAILHGPQVGNFRDIYGLLHNAGGTVTVADAAALGRSIVELVTDETRRAAIADTAETTVAAGAGAIARTLEHLEPLLASVHVGRR